jgi:hypothetical protein
LWVLAFTSVTRKRTTMSDASDIKLNEYAWVPLGKALIISAGMFSGAWIVATQLSELKQQVHNLEARMDLVWTRENMGTYSNELRWENRNIGPDKRDLYVPDARSIR